jgi:hypothetical protein
LQGLRWILHSSEPHPPPPQRPYFLQPWVAANL